MAWAGIILGGGDGKRLRTLTRALTGDDRPKQFCAVVGRETLLEQTRRRARLLIPHERLLTVVTRKHERYFRPALVDAAPGTVVVQPEARGTAIAVLYALLRLEALGSTSAVAVLPSDHYVSDDGVFMTHVLSAFKIVQARRDLVVVLGIVADRPEPAYGSTARRVDSRALANAALPRGEVLGEAAGGGCRAAHGTRVSLEQPGARRPSCDAARDDLPSSTGARHHIRAGRRACEHVVGKRDCAASVRAGRSHGPVAAGAGGAFDAARSAAGQHGALGRPRTTRTRVRDSRTTARATNVGVSGVGRGLITA